MSGTVPHALEKAHRLLADVLREGMEHRKRNLRCGEGRKVCRAVERFVGELSHLPAAWEELQRRAGLVGGQCSPGTDYDRAKSEALRSYCGRPRKRSGFRLAIGKLRDGCNRHLVLLAEVIKERDNLERLLEERERRLSAESLAAFEAWLEACKEIQRETERLEVDGCRYLYNVYRASQANPPEQACFDQAMMASEIGCVHYGRLLDAVESMVAWIGDTPTAAPENGDAITDREGRTPSKELKQPEAPVIEVERWADLGIGIDEDGSYRAISPCPQCGGVFPKEKAVTLELPGDQWKNLLDLLAQSEEGNAASKEDVMFRFGYLKAGDLPTDQLLVELNGDKAKMHTFNQARRLLTGAMADLGRRLREHVKIRSPDGPPLTVAKPKIVRAGFVVRHLVRDKDGKLRFGRKPQA